MYGALKNVNKESFATYSVQILLVLKQQIPKIAPDSYKYSRLDSYLYIWVCYSRVVVLHNDLGTGEKYFFPITTIYRFAYCSHIKHVTGGGGSVVSYDSE